MSDRELWTIDLGTMPYTDALDLQRAVARARIGGAVPQDVLLLVEHPPVITLGRAADPAHVLLPPAALAQRGIVLREAARGGDVTVHAPGQLVGYPIVDLRPRGRDVHHYLRDLEEVLIRALVTWGIEAERCAGATGVWVGNEKVAAIGVGVKRWVTWHGFALNAAIDLSKAQRMAPDGACAGPLAAPDRRSSGHAVHQLRQSGRHCRGGTSGRRLRRSRLRLLGACACRLRGGVHLSWLSRSL